MLSHPTSIVEINKDSQSISIETKTGDAPTISDIILYLYGDQYKEKLLVAVKIELYALVVLYSKVKAGIQAT